jgi:hypothetical protein
MFLLFVFALIFQQKKKKKKEGGKDAEFYSTLDFCKVSLLHPYYIVAFLMR